MVFKLLVPWKKSDQVVKLQKRPRKRFKEDPASETRFGLAFAGPLGSFASQNFIRNGVSSNPFFARVCAVGQLRGVLSVDIPDNQMVERMMRVLKRKAINEKYEEKWREEYHVRKGEKRRLQLKAAKFAIFRAQFRERMKWIYRRRARGF